MKLIQTVKGYGYLIRDPANAKTNSFWNAALTSAEIGRALRQSVRDIVSHTPGPDGQTPTWPFFFQRQGQYTDKRPTRRDPDIVTIHV